MHICLAALLLAQNADPARTATLRVTIPEGLPDRVIVHVFRAGDAREEAQLLSSLLHGIDMYDSFFNPTVIEGHPKIDRTSWSMALAPGAYHVRMGRNNTLSAVWQTNVKIAAGETKEFAFDPRITGSLKGTWSIDVSAHKILKEGPIAFKAALVRDGKVWAKRDLKEGHAFELQEVPPGEYSLVAEEFYEHFVWIQDNVKIAEGKQTVVAVNVRRQDMGGMKVELTSGGKPLPELSTKDYVFADSRNRYARDVGMWGNGGLLGTAKAFQMNGICFFDVPVGLEYTLWCFPKEYQPVEKKGLKVKPVVLQKGTGPFETEVYPLVKLSLSPVPAKDDKSKDDKKPNR